MILSKKNQLLLVTMTSILGILLLGGTKRVEAESFEEQLHIRIQQYPQM